jgi:hypothetical protein
MPGLVPGIHVLPQKKQDVDGRDKPGHDGNLYFTARSAGEISTLNCRHQMITLW